MKIVLMFLAKLLFSIIFYALFWKFFKRIKLIIELQKNGRISTYINEILYRNIKAEYLFIDHAINEYEDDLSIIVLEESVVKNELCFVLERLDLNKNQFDCFIENMSTIIKDSYTDEYLTTDCIFISFVSHNRDQRKQNDEAHWFKIKCFKSNIYNRLLSEQIWWHIKNYENMNQPQMINKMYPYICEGELLCNIVYNLKEEYVICRRNSKSMQLDPYMVICFDDLFIEGVYEIDISYMINYIDNYLKKEFTVMDVKITDIGIEMGRITLFVNVKIDPPKSECNDSQYVHLTKKSFLNIDKNHFLSKEYHSLTRIFYKL